MSINKVIVNDSIKLDLTADTVTVDTLKKGVTAHNAAGDIITGELEGLSGVNRKDNDKGGETVTVKSDGSSSGGGSNEDWIKCIQNQGEGVTELPSELTSIGDYAFEYCEKLALTKLPDGITSIGENAFMSCSNLALTSLPKGVTVIGCEAFNSCKALTNIMIPPALERLEDYAFAWCSNMTGDVYLPDTLTYLGSGVFQGTTDITIKYIPNGLTNWGQSGVFAGVYVPIDVIPNTLTSTCSYMFGNSKIDWSTIPDSITTLGDSTFSQCKNITTMNIPVAITVLPDYVFSFCTGLTSVTFKGTPTTISSTAFAYSTNLTNIYVPWSEGAVADAPWGATNATIHYNAEV